jgi:type IV pilus assembly protein PilM
MIDFNLKIRNQLPIGLDIGHHSIKMIQLSCKDGKFGVVAAHKIQMDTSPDADPQQRREFVVSSVSKMIESGDFRGSNVVTCLPNESIQITSLRLAEASENGIKQALNKEVVQRFGLDPDKDQINYMLAGDVRQGDEIRNELILFAAADESVREHIAMLEEAQLTPVGIDAMPCALFRCFERLLRRQEDKERSVVIVDIGSRHTTVIFARGPEISFVKQIPLGGESFRLSIAAKLGISPDEAEILRDKLGMERDSQAAVLSGDTDANGRKVERLDASTRQVMVDAITSVAEDLAKEISLCFRYYTVTFRGKRVEQAIFSGGGAYESILLNVLKRQLAVEIEVAPPLKGFDTAGVCLSSDRRSILSEWAVAVGLSLKGWKRNVSDRKVSAVAVGEAG